MFDGNYQSTLSARYGLLIPVAWLAAFHNRKGVMSFDVNHWKLYPVRDWSTWLIILSSMYETAADPLPDTIKARIKSAKEIQITHKGEIIMPESLRLLPPGLVQVVGHDGFLEVWPVEVWFEEEEKRLRVSMTIDEYLKAIAKFPPAPLDRLPPDN